MKKLDRLVDHLYKLLKQGLDEACPETSVQGKINGSLWATEKHAVEKHRVTQLYRQAVDSKAEADWATYRLADKQFKARCKKDKNRAWREYKEGLQTQKDMASLVRLAQRQERRDINTLQRPDGTMTDPGKETADVLTRTHFPAATNLIHVTYNNRRNCSTAELKDKYNDWVNPHLLRKALAGLSLIHI